METACLSRRITTQKATRWRKYRKKEPIETQEKNLAQNHQQLRIKGHCYQAQTIEQAHKLFLSGEISLRGTQKVFELFNSSSNRTPCFTTIRKWLARIGIYELTREKQFRDDWILILDFTVELGKQKALVVLGVSQEYLRERVISQRRGLSHEDVELLALEIMDSSKEEIIWSKLEQITNKIGVPKQIVADHGSDLARGIKLYQQNHPQVIYTHDVTHKMALLLKSRLEKEERYHSFPQQCNLCRQKLQQTELSF